MIAAPLEVSEGEGSKIDRKWRLGSFEVVPLQQTV